MRGVLGVAVCLALAQAQAQAQTALAQTAPQLTAGSAFFIRPQQAETDRIAELGFDGLRDGAVWAQVEQVPEEYRFDHPSIAALRQLADLGLLGSVTLWPDSGPVEEGQTIVTDDGLAAFGRFANAMALAFPDLPAFEIGNEVNSTSFVRGPAQEMTSEERAGLHVRHLQAVASQPAMQGRRIIGGSTHSIAAGFLWQVLDAGGGAFMDAVAVHPYTSPPEHLARDVAYLRRHPAMAGLDVEMTEFGALETQSGPDRLWQEYCAMSVAGVTRAVWYPLEPRFDGFLPLFDDRFALTPTGEVFAYLKTHAEGGTVAPLRPDRYGYGCLFGESLAVLWGVPRSVEITSTGIEVLDARLAPLAPPYSLSPDRVLVLRADRTFDPAQDIVFGPVPVLADSYHDYDLPAEGLSARDLPGFARFLRIAGQEAELTTCPGQNLPWSPWVPHLCSANDAIFVQTPDSFTLGGGDDRPIELVHRFTAPEAMRVSGTLSLQVHEQSSDGMTVTVLRNGEAVQQSLITGEQQVDIADIALSTGDQLDIVFGPNASPYGDVADRVRLTLNRIE